MSVLSFRKAKAPVALSPERQALADAIQRLANAKAAVVTAEETRAEATDKIWAAQDALERVASDRERATDRAADFVRAKIAGDAAEPPGLRRRQSFEQREAKARREIEAWEEVRKATFALADEQRLELKNAEWGLDAAVAAVIRAEAGVPVEALVSRLEQLNAEATVVRAGLHELLWKGKLTGEVEQRIKNAMGAYGRGIPWALADVTPPGYEQQPGKRLMDAALAQLKTDATAPLPTLDQLRSVADAV